jgi:hypothetical protein
LGDDHRLHPGRQTRLEWEAGLVDVALVVDVASNLRHASISQFTNFASFLG